MLAFLAASCIEKSDVRPGSPVDVDIDHYQTAGTYDVPVKEGCITVVKAYGVTLAEAESPMTIWVPRMTLTRSDEGLTTTFVPRDEYPNFAGNKSQLFQVVCFEDSRRGDYDYNDLVIHVLYQTRQNIFGFGVQPVALGSTKSIKLGCVVYKGGKRIFKGLITPEGADCRSQYFKSMEGTLNTYDKANIKVGEYLGSTIRNWDVSKIEGNGPMRVEWYIEVDNGVELYALSTAYLNDSFDKDKLPYGLVITTTGTEYVDEKGGYLCGFDWFNYPRESVHIKEVYPEMWNWLTTDSSYNFADIYDGRNVPANACPAADLGLFEARTIDVTNRKYRAAVPSPIEKSNPAGLLFFMCGLVVMRCVPRGCRIARCTVLNARYRRRVLRHCRPCSRLPVPILPLQDGAPLFVRASTPGSPSRGWRRARLRIPHRYPRHRAVRPGSIRYP